MGGLKISSLFPKNLPEFVHAYDSWSEFSHNLDVYTDTVIVRDNLFYPDHILRTGESDFIYLKNPQKGIDIIMNEIPNQIVLISS